LEYLACLQTHLAPEVATPAQRRGGFLEIARSALLFLTLGALWFVLCRHLSNEWSLNEQYNYGWFVPFFALYLFWLRWEDAPRTRRSEQLSVSGSQPNNHSRITNNAVIAITAIALLILLPIRVFEIGNPDWRPLGWIHATIVAGFSFVILWSIGGKSWLRHFAFPILFFFVSVPWISLIETPVVEGLMRIIASLTAETVSLLGIPAQVQGNLIRIARGVVGVNEACSGVRSLQTSIMIGLLFGELKRLSSLRRAILLAGTVAIALIANFFRAVFLVCVACANEVGAVGRWHDVAGYAIVALVFVASLGLATWLGRKATKVQSRKAKVENRGERSEVRDRQSVFLISNFYFLISTLVWVLAVEIGAEGWYRAHERNLVARSGWTIRAPETTPGYREIPIDEGVRQTLRFDTGRELVWKINSGTPTKFSATNYLFFFRWNPSGSSVVRARAHRPDICLPSAGWRQIADLGVKIYSATQNIVLPIRHITFEQERGKAVAHAFFCLQEDKIHPNEPRPDLQLGPGIQPDWASQGRLRVVRNGVRNLGQQVLEIVIVSQQPIEDGAAERNFARLIRELVVPL
jgi:exosortase